MAEKKEPKTLIGVLASHDSGKKNNELARLFEELYKKDRKLLDKFHFVFTGGTFKRLVLGEDIDDVTKTADREPIIPISKEVADFIKPRTTHLPSRRVGGVTILSNLVVQRQCSILWTFFSPITVHWLSPENLALMRLCEVWNAKRLMNSESVRAWFRDEAERDITRNPQKIPLQMIFGTGGTSRARQDPRKGYYEIEIPERRLLPEEFWYRFEQQTIALIAHDEMKKRMVDFAIQYEHELCLFDHILATGHTGQDVMNACRTLGENNKVKRCLSGPRGGDIEIATAIIFDKCHIVIFFIDPLRPHPHIEDIRVVFSACMAEIDNNDVRMLTNEVQAREWIEEAVRRRC